MIIFLKKQPLISLYTVKVAFRKRDRDHSLYSKKVTLPERNFHLSEFHNHNIKKR